MNSESSNSYYNLIQRVIDFIRHYRVILVPVIVVLLIVLLFRDLPSRDEPVRAYAADQLIVIGDPDWIDRVIGDAFGDGSGGVMSAVTVLDSLAPIELPGPSDATSVELPPNYAVRLLDVSRLEVAAPERGTESMPVDRVIAAYGAIYESTLEINSGRRVNADPIIVVASPNYLTGIIGGYGSPWELVEGDPKDGPGGVGPNSEGTPIPTATARALFADQWALDDLGTPVPASGNGVQIVVFDTSPFPTGTALVGWSAPSFEIGVRQSTPLPTLPGQIDLDLASQVKQHGLAVTSLAHAVAPDASFLIYRVLDDSGRGTIFEFLHAMYTFLNGAPKSNGKLSTPTVLNLSLGIRCDQIASVNPTVEANVEALATVIAGTYPGFTGASPCTGGDNIPAMHIPIALARHLGAIVVAASGNDSGSVSEGSQLPALYDEVISVSGMTKAGDLTCFSNEGQISAPAGGYPFIAGGPCVGTGLTAQCSDDIGLPGIPVACDEALIALVNPASFVGTSLHKEFANGHAFWLGTSFAAPLVSGQFAQLLQQASGVNALDPVHIEKQARCGADGTFNLLDVEGGSTMSEVIEVFDALKPACKPTPTPTP